MELSKIGFIRQNGSAQKEEKAAMANKQTSAIQFRAGKHRIFPAFSCAGAFLCVQYRPASKVSASRLAGIAIEYPLGDPFSPGV